MFILRLPSAICLIGLFLGATLWDSPYGYQIFTALAILMAFLGTKEFCSMLEKINKPTYKSLTALTAVAIIAISLRPNLVNFELEIPIIALFAVFCWVSLLFSKQKELFLDKAMNSAAALIFLSIPLTFIVKIYLMNEMGPKYLFFMVLATKFGDMGAYATGTVSNIITKGKNKPIVPNISPKKSWQGTIGGMFISIGITYFLRNQLELPLDNLITGILGFCMFWGGFYGDLVESCMKRITTVKDSGNIIPGIGGVMDLLDSLILNAPIFYIILKLI